MIAFTTWIGENPNLPLDYVKNIQSWINVGGFKGVRIYYWEDDEIQRIVTRYPFLKEWRRDHKYALCADFLRYAIPVYTIKYDSTCYLDADVTVLDNLVRVLRDDFCTAKEDNTNYGASVLLSSPTHWFCKLMVDCYETHFAKIRASFESENPLNVLTAPKILTEVINSLPDEQRERLNLIDDVSVFYPVFPWEEDGTQFTKNTKAIHWNDGAWVKNKVELKETEEEISAKFLKTLTNLY